MVDNVDVAAVSTPGVEERRKCTEESSERCPSSIFPTCGHNEWPDFFFRGRYSPSPPRDSILIQAGITNFRHRALVSDRILTARYILLQSGFTSRALLLQLRYPPPSIPFFFLLSFFVPILSVIYFLASEERADQIYDYIMNYSHWDERGRADSAAKEPSMVGTAPFPTNRSRTDSHRCVPEIEACN